MIAALFLIFGFFMAIVSSEMLLRGIKIQTALSKVLAAHLFWFAIVWIYMVQTNGFSVITLLIFWAGAFLTWFGVRSHIESSILLRMLYLLRSHPRKESDLLKDYELHYSEASRLEELFRGGLLSKNSGEVMVTPKGRFIASVALHLK
jgi:hypothetical protein